MVLHEAVEDQPGQPPPIGSEQPLHGPLHEDIRLVAIERNLLLLHLVRDRDEVDRPQDRGDGDERAARVPHRVQARLAGHGFGPPPGPGASF